MPDSLMMAVLTRFPFWESDTPSPSIVNPVKIGRVPRVNLRLLIFEKVRHAGSHSIFSVVDGAAHMRPPVELWTKMSVTA